MSCPWILCGVGTRASMVLSSSFTPCAPPRCMLARSLPCRGHLQSLAASRQRLQVVCMAHPRRVARVSSQIQREIGDMFVSDPVIQAAICPERKGGGDTLSAVASITNTYVSNDLQVVKVFVSVYSDDYGKRVAMQNLQRLEPYVRRLVGQRVRLRRTPEVRFVYDDSEEEADLLVRVLGREEVERYRSEIESELAPGRSALASAAPEGDSHEAGEGFGEEEEFAEDEAEEEELYEDPDELPQEYPNPFGDLFGDVSGDTIVGHKTRRKGPQRRGSGGKGPHGANVGNGGEGAAGTYARNQEQEGQGAKASSVAEGQ